MNRIKVTNHTKGTKMHLMHSISTFPLLNKRCLKRSKNKNSICSNCYSFTMLKQYTGLKNNLIHNTKLLTEQIITPTLLNDAIFRFESFGDLINENQLHNYVLIVKKNKHVKFALFSKNYDIIKSYFDNNKKPTNLQILFSSHLLNRQYKIENLQYIDKVFTVYTKQFAEKNNIHINCGKKKCIECRVCYFKSKINYINEIKK